MGSVSSALVRATGIRKSFGGIEVVSGVDLELRAGEVHAIVGENGAGKSTLAKVIAGVHRPEGGELELMGRRISLEGPRHAISLGIALIHQEPLTFPDLDVAENIFVGHQPTGKGLAGVDWRQMRLRAGEILENLGVALDPRQRVGRLTIADQQMVELAAALSQDAKVLLMDETTSSLTPKEVSELFAIVRRLCERGCVIGFVSHHLDEVFEIADRITVMRDGAKVAEVLTRETSVPEIVRLMVGREVEAIEPSPRRSTEQGPILSVENLSRKGLFAGVSFEVRPGEIVGLGGLVGAGRTDVCRAVFGLERIDSGRIQVKGQDVRIGGPRQAMRHGLAMVPEDRQFEGLLMDMSLSDNATLAVLGRIAVRGFLRRRTEQSRTQEALDRLRTSFRNVLQPVRELSGGNQQKVVLSKWLMSEPSVLILDEPTRGVDVGAKDEVHRLMRQLVEGGMAILLVSSDLPELLTLSDRVLVMRDGRIVAGFDREEATPERVMSAATGQEVHAA